MIKKGEKNQIDSFSPIQLKLIIPATHYFPLSRKIGFAKISASEEEGYSTKM
jgi:hypothetical protein